MPITDKLRMEHSNLEVVVDMGDSRCALSFRSSDDHGAERAVVPLLIDDVPTLCSFLLRMRRRAAEVGKFYVKGGRVANDRLTDMFLFVGPMSYDEAVRIWREQSFAYIDQADVQFRLVSAADIDSQD